MQRPPSIVRFGQLYLAGIVLSVIGWAIDWPLMQERLAADPRTERFGWMLVVVAALSIAVPVLLWFLTARRASGVARWIVIVLAALSVVRMLIDLPAFLGGGMSALSFGVGAATTLLSLASAALLFRADARAWFGEQAGEGE